MRWNVSDVAQQTRVEKATAGSGRERRIYLNTDTTEELVDKPP